MRRTALLLAALLVLGCAAGAADARQRKKHRKLRGKVVAAKVVRLHGRAHLVPPAGRAGDPGPPGHADRAGHPGRAGRPAAAAAAPAAARRARGAPCR